MSTQFYGYRIARDSFWEAVDKIRDFYYEESVLMSLARDTYAKTEAVRRRADLSDKEKLEKIVALRNAFEAEATEELTVQLQAFEEPGSDNFIFRVLERGHLFANSFEKQDWGVEPFFYDNRSDVSAEEKERHPLVNHFDACITTRRYFLVPVIEVIDATMHLSGLDTSPQGRRAQIANHSAGTAKS